jgi:hypothetical protein
VKVVNLKFKVLSSLRQQIMLAAFSLLLPLIILAFSGYYIYLSTVDSFDAVQDDVFLQVLPTGELREFLYKASIPVTNHLVSSNQEEREKYEKLKQQIELSFKDLLDTNYGEGGLANKNILQRAWQE